MRSLVSLLAHFTHMSMEGYINQGFLTLFMKLILYDHVCNRLTVQWFPWDYGNAHLLGVDVKKLSNDQAYKATA